MTMWNLYMCLVRECRELEESFVWMRLRKGRAVREMIYQQDRQTLVDRCGEKAPVITEVAGQVGWARLWDAALDSVENAVRGMQMLSRVTSHHGRGGQPCPLSR